MVLFIGNVQLPPLPNMRLIVAQPVTCNLKLYSDSMTVAMTPSLKKIKGNFYYFSRREVRRNLKITVEISIKNKKD